jgi:hypothetical protein
MTEEELKSREVDEPQIKSYYKQFGIEYHRRPL